MITVYTRPGCGTCTATKLWLKGKGIPFNEIDIEESRTDIVERLGYTQLPVVVVDRPGGDHDHWSGFRIEKLAALKVFHPRSDDGVIDG